MMQVIAKKLLIFCELLPIINYVLEKGHHFTVLNDIFLNNWIHYIFSIAA